MKKFFSTVFLFISLSVAAFAQSVPQTMSYQAVVRDVNGQLYANKIVSVTISILKNNALGDAVYTESQNVPTNANGLMSLEFGNDDDFATIDWANGPYFIKTETNVNGTIIEATSQLLSVPYAKYAETAGNLEEYVRKSDLDKYVDEQTRAVVARLFKVSAVKAVQSEDSVDAFFKALYDYASNPELIEEDQENNPIENELLGSDNEDGKLLSAQSCGVDEKYYKYLTDDPSRWGYGLGDLFSWISGEWITYAKCTSHCSEEQLKNVMAENLSTGGTKGFTEWESKSTQVFDKSFTNSVLTDLLEENYETYENLARNKSRLGESAVDNLLKEWTSEDYAKWDKTAREELGDEVVDAILEALLDEEGGWEKYVEYAKTDNDGAVYKKITNIGVNSDGSTNGVFSVSAIKTVRFSKGNLQYQGSSNTWRFAECQFDAVAGESNNHVGENGGNVYVNNTHCDNINVSSSYSGWIDLFAWGTSGKMVVNGDSTYTAYLPYSISGDASDYYYGETLAGTVADWGVNMGSQWRTLTTEEWDYLYQGRAGAADKIAYATITTKKNVNGSDVSIEVPGIVLLPDNWVGNPAKCKPFSASLSFSANQYTEEQWYAMQATGAVFLPASGVRKISDKSNLTNHVWLTSTKTYAAYWTADAQKNGSALAYWFVGSDDKLIQQQPYTKTAGMCVRLVTDNN